MNNERIKKITQRKFCVIFILAGEEGLEPPTDGFGDHYSTN